MSANMDDARQMIHSTVTLQEAQAVTLLPLVGRCRRPTLRRKQSRAGPDLLRQTPATNRSLLLLLFPSASVGVGYPSLLPCQLLPWPINQPTVHFV